MKQKILLFLGCMLVALGLQAQNVQTVTYAQSSKSETIKLTSPAPANATVTFNNTYTSNKVQLTGGNSMTYTFSGFDGYTITGITLSMRSNKSAGTGSLDVKVGKTTIASIATATFKSSAWNGSYSQSYVDITPAVTETLVKEGENLVITIAASVNSLYCQSVTISYKGASLVEEATLPEVSPVGGDSSDDALTIEQGTEITITPIENNTATYSINDAEAITITEATIFNANEVGAMKLAVTSTLGSDSKTATYYYDVVAETPKVTALLTTDEYENQTTPGTYTNTSVKSKTGVWNGNMIVNSTDLQLRAKDGAHIQSPVFPGKVVSVSVVFSNNTTTNTARGFVVMPSTFTGTSATKDTKDCLGSASYKGKDDPTSTVELSKEIYSFKIYATGGAIYMKSIKVVYEKPDDHVLKVGSTGWATLSLGLDTKIPSGLNCYAISSVANETATLTAISEVLPAHTSVIVKGEPNTDYTFEYLDGYLGAYGECNMLEGSIANTYIAGDAYVLANGNNGVGLYKATLNKDAEGKTGTTHFLNNANKAYLPVSALTAEQRSNGFRLHIGGTTSIQNSEFNIQDSAIIYDLQGRRVEKMEKGIYIVNGKKVIVK